MVNVFRLCSIINSLYGQVARNLETCSRLWRIMSARLETCSRLWRIMSPRAEVRSGGRGLGNLFTAVTNHVAPSRSTVRWQGTWKLVHGCGESCRDMIRHSREQVSKSPAT